MKLEEIKDFLNEKVEKYNCPSFIQTDPIQIPHQFTRHEDIEISAFLTTTIAWGRREAIINGASEIVNRLNQNPYSFLLNAEPADIQEFIDFKYRTFNGIDMVFYLTSLKNIYENFGGLKKLFTDIYNESSELNKTISGVRKRFFEIPHPARTGKHFPDIAKGAAAKRMNLFLKWMVRRDKNGVDFGIWREIDPADLYIPLDVHTGNVARKLGLLRRKQNDWKAVEELTAVLRQMDPADPVKYDYALFGLGVFEGF